jgi:uncharacterized phage protein gp47/JayE
LPENAKPLAFSPPQRGIYGERLMNIAKDENTIRKELFAHIEEVQAEYIKNGWLPQEINLNNGVIRGLLEIHIYGIYQLYQYMDFVMQQATPKTASGEWLDMHAGGVDLVRKEAVKARGELTFTRSAAYSGNIKIPAGKILRTPVDAEGKRYRYVTEAETVLPAGVESIKAAVIAEDYGAKANATAGLICEFATQIQHIAAVANEADWLLREGTDRESDSQLLERYILQWRAKAGVTTAAYHLAALSVNGVRAVKIFDQHPRGQGTVDVVILGTGGAATEQLIEAVEAAIAGEIIINDDVLVKSVTPVAINLALTIRYTYGSAVELKAKAESLIRARMEDSIGADVVLARVISDVINIPGVDRVVWTTPEADIAIAADEVAQLAALNISMLQVVEG